MWVEYDPYDCLAQRLAVYKLTAAERAELAKLTEQRRLDSDRHRLVVERDQQERAEAAARLAAGFNPDLLNLDDPVGDPRELDLTQLVAEIEHAEHTYRHADHHLVYPHREALYREFQRRREFDELMKLSRADRIRLDLASQRVNAARHAPFVTDPATTTGGADLAADYSGPAALGYDPEPPF
ncbi:hypothetical protein FG87_36165 [Nocardia vulneris]|uniref:Uncharacterized protein n=2 Tax=Nocardia vulneris TaxID=1141657 RepID=A0ABR4Z5C7_9NOCA|nr:hypothetical protein FG87_36165 [Nocardia vulneris]